MIDRIPAFYISVGDKDITQIVSERFVNLTLTLCRSDESDQLDITLEDNDGQLSLPPIGAKINVHLGWKGSPLVDMGLFNVDEVEHSGPPDILTIRARAANLIDTFKQLQERSFHQKSLGAIIEIIAFENELVPAVADEFRATVIKHIAQTHESDAAFLRRLGKLFDAVATVKNGRLLFMPIGRGRTRSGKPLPIIHIERSDGDTHRYHAANENSYSGVRTYWYDGKGAHRHSVVAGMPGNSKRMRTTFANEQDARKAAEAEWQRIQRGVATFEVGLAEANLAIIPESYIAAYGFKTQINVIKWISQKVTHEILQNGFITKVECETKVNLSS